MNRKFLLLSILAFVGASLGINALVENNAGNDSGMGMDHSSHSSKMNGDDAMFLQMMIPHHQQAILLSDLAIANSKNQQVLDLAKQIKDAQAPEIEQMKIWLKAAGQGEDPGHSMHSMAGMLSDSEIEQLKAARGNQFDMLFLKGMIAHHQGAVDMVAMIEDSRDAKIKEFGSKIKSSQNKEIELMNNLLKDIGQLDLALFAFIYRWALGWLEGVSAKSWT